MSVHVRVWVSVCVCVRERERERERLIFKSPRAFHFAKKQTLHKKQFLKTEKKLIFLYTVRMSVDTQIMYYASR